MIIKRMIYGEENIPWLEAWDGQFYTPKEIKLHKLCLKSNTRPSISLLKERFRRRVEQGRVLPISRIDCSGCTIILTAERQLSEVIRDTRIGKDILKAELGLMKFIAGEA